jgi:hypothetical protein
MAPRRSPTVRHASAQEAAMKKSFALALVLAVGVVFTSVTLAQRNDAYQFADRDGVWTVKTSDQSMTAIRLLPAQRQVVVQKRDAIFDVIRASKVLNPLKGNDIDAEKSVVARADDDGHYPTTGPVVMMVQLWFRHFFMDEKTGRVVHATVGMNSMNFVTNDLAAIAWWGPNRLYGGLRDERGHSVFLEPRVSTTVAGRTSYRMSDYGEVVVLTNGRPLWLPLTQEQFLRAVMNQVRLMRADEIEKGRTGSYPSISDDESFWVKRLHVFEKELAALTPGERQQPAYWSDPPRDNPFLSGLTKRETYGARLVVMTNPDYFDPSLPRTAVQLIACEFDFLGTHDADEPGPAYSSTVRLFWQFEYDKLAALIEGAGAPR